MTTAIEQKNTGIVQTSKNVRNLVTESTSEATRRAYRSDWRIFCEWCDASGLLPLPATEHTIAEFLADQAGSEISPSTLNRRIAAIKYAHEAAGHDSKTGHKLVSATLKGIRRTSKKKQERKSAATVDKIYAMVAQIDTSTLQGKRDRAILLMGFAGAFRRSELAGLQMSDIDPGEHGAKVTIRKSKTDQEGEGQTIAIYNGKLNTIGALQAYLYAGGITEGPVFRPVTRGGNLRDQQLSDDAVGDIVKRYAEAAGFDPAEFSGHSLRAGFVTSAAEAGANLFKIMDVSRHKSVQTVRTYVRSADLFKDHAGSSFL